MCNLLVSNYNFTVKQSGFEMVDTIPKDIQVNFSNHNVNLIYYEEKKNNTRYKNLIDTKMEIMDELFFN